MNSGRRAIILLSAGLSALWAVAQAQAQSVETTSHILVSRASVGLTQPWLAPREELSMDALMRLLNVAHLDPALDAQVNGLMDSVGLTAETLLPLLHLCPPNDDQGTGEFHEPLIRRSIIAIDPLSPLGGPPRPLPWTADVIDAARNAPAGHTVETRTTTLGEVRSAKGLGTMCIERSVVDEHGRPQDITLFEAFTTFMHELTHLARWQRWLQDSLMEYESFDAFVDAELMRPGGEWRPMWPKEQRRRASCASSLPALASCLLWRATLMLRVSSRMLPVCAASSSPLSVPRAWATESNSWKFFKVR